MSDESKELALINEEIAKFNAEKRAHTEMGILNASIFYPDMEKNHQTRRCVFRYYKHQKMLQLVDGEHLRDTIPYRMIYLTPSDCKQYAPGRYDEANPFINSNIHNLVIAYFNGEDDEYGFAEMAIAVRFIRYITYECAFNMTDGSISMKSYLQAVLKKEQKIFRGGRHYMFKLPEADCLSIAMTKKPSAEQERQMRERLGNEYNGETFYVSIIAAE
jgi:hypothetical protein